MNGCDKDRLGTWTGRRGIDQHKMSMAHEFWWPRVAAFLAFLGVGAAVVCLPGFRFAYSDTDYLSFLLARGFFQEVLVDQGLPECLPLQNGNLLVIALIRLAEAIPVSPGILLGMGQGILAAMLFGQMQRLARRWVAAEDRMYVFWLVLAQPGIWRMLFCAPGEGVTAVLFIGALAHSPLKGEKASGWPVWLFLLSFSGLDGFFLALLLALCWPLGEGIATRQGDETSGSWPVTAVLSIAAIMPSVLFYGLLTLQWGVLAGPRLAGFPSLSGDVAVEKLLNGLWTQHIQEWLIWAGKGFTRVPVNVPLFGILFFLGIAAAWNDEAGTRILAIRTAWLFSLASIGWAFTAPGAARQGTWALFFFALIFVLRGARWLLDCLGVRDSRWSIVPVFLLAGLSIISTPLEWEEITVRARYFQQVCESIEKVLEIRGEGETAAVRFSPVVFSLAVNRLHPIPYPAGLTLEYGIHESGSRREGIRFDFRQSRIPDQVIYYPDLEEQWRPELTVMGTGIRSLWEAALDPFYEKSREHNLEVYQRAAPKEMIAAVWAEDLRLEGNTRSPAAPEDLEALGGAPAVGMTDPLAVPRSMPVGMKWDFESGFENTRRLGLAFGFHPPILPAAAGLRGVVSGTDETAGLLGVLRSEPFRIEGEEMTFVAALPEDSTSAFFCLAVYQETPYGESGETRQTRHLFEYEPPAPLMPDTFYYVLPANLRYSGNTVTGWRVVRLLQQTPDSQPQWVRWSLDPWINRQAVWLAADRDRNHFLFVDQIQQWKRPPGLYFTFEDGHYGDWEITGEAFGSRPANGPLAGQRPIAGYEGNFLINSFFGGSDRPTGTLTSPFFIIPGHRMEFSIGGGEDLERVYLALRVGNQVVLRETGEDSETLRRVVWDVEPWAGKPARIQIVDRSSDPWGHILVDDIRFYAREENNASHSQ